MNIFKRFWKSLYSPQDIASFRKDKVSKSIIYIIVLSFLAFLPLAYYTTTTTQNALKLSEETLEKQIPDFTVADGKLQTKDGAAENLPISIDEGSLHIYYDASGTLDKDDVDNKIGSYESAFAFLSDGIYITAGGMSQSFSYSALGISDKADLMSIYSSITDVSKYVIPLILFVLFLFMLGSAFFRVAIYGLFGFILSGFGRGGISYKENWMMAAYSITLATVFTMIMEWFQIQVPFGMEINIGVSLIIIFLAIRTIPQDKKE
ncbi:hypothetical protein MFLO_03555 [Listeria floridensis FSL S10-1187]|uniref:DUF1189 domain-containing protein n=1 Tax=Listeria floridensis FSL S10-1187 TaxID=1265817 RepID=A0ABN0RHR0_9LIST|nr:DUF1189 domain-containing protein [Listeria floridensis]EUJ33377.1 hypothetical protein MFLO_03555 [Listeria floridensis FSL S10-1187]